MCLSFHLRSAQVVWLMRKLSRPSTLSSFPKGVNTYVFHYINRCVYWFSKFILFILSIFYYSLRCHHIRPFPVQCIWSWQKWLHSFWGENLFTHSVSLYPQFVFLHCPVFALTLLLSLAGLCDWSVRVAERICHWKAQLGFQPLRHQQGWLHH